MFTLTDLHLQLSISLNSMQQQQELSMKLLVVLALAVYMLSTARPFDVTLPGHECKSKWQEVVVVKIVRGWENQGWGKE